MSNYSYVWGLKIGRRVNRINPTIKFLSKNELFQVFRFIVFRESPIVHFKESYLTLMNFDLYNIKHYNNIIFIIYNHMDRYSKNSTQRHYIK